MSEPAIARRAFDGDEPTGIVGFTAMADGTKYDYELLDAGERVVMLLDLKMRGRTTGIEMPFGKFAWVSTFKDGMVVYVKLYMSQAEALEAAGLSE